MAEDEQAPGGDGPPAAPSYSLLEIVLYFLKLGTVGFGGPVALTGYMHRDLVEDRAWITGSDYKDGLALAQLAPGPLAPSSPSISATSTTASSARRWSALPS